MSENERSDESRAGMPGHGAGRREQPGKTGVYPMSGPAPDEDAPVRNQESWGQGGAGEAGYDDSGASEIIPNERLTGDVTSTQVGGEHAGGVDAAREASDEPGRTPGTGRVTEDPEGSDALGE